MADRGDYERQNEEEEEEDDELGEAVCWTIPTSFKTIANIHAGLQGAERCCHIRYWS